MNTTARFLTIGAIGGLIWSLALNAVDWVSAGDTAKLVIAGVLSGATVSLLIGPPLARLGRWGAFVFGLLSAPFGAFLFGFLYGFISDHHAFMDGLPSGLWGGMISVLVYALYFVPSAILTAFLLRAVVLHLKCFPWIIANLGVVATLVVAAVWWHPHGVSLSRSEEKIRVSILKITPLGTPIEEVKARIQTKLHPNTFYFYKHADEAGMPPVVREGKSVPGQWPLGGEHHGKEIGCQIGQGGRWDEDDVGADWVFDDKDRLADVLVSKSANLP